MNNARVWTRLTIAAFFFLLIGGIGTFIGARLDNAAFYSAWLCAFLFWLGLPLGAMTLVLVHDLSGGRWMASARPVLEAAIVTMPLASLALLPVLFGLDQVYHWSASDHEALANVFYLNNSFFFLRYAIYVVIWNGLAAWALWAPRVGALGVPASLSWVSGVGLVLLAFSAAFATIDWVMSLDPHFWSAVMPMFVSAGWFNTGLALVVLIVALGGVVLPRGRDHLADLTAILLATTIFWAYTEFCQFLIIWEENLSREIVWYLRRMAPPWQAWMYTIAAIGFFVPFFVLVWRPSKRNRAIVAAMAILILLGQLLHVWWLVLPEMSRGFSWIDVAAIFALGGLLLLFFLYRLRYGRLLPVRAGRVLETSHGQA